MNSAFIDYESEFACEGHTLNINCRRGEVISVINVNYGRLNRKHCVHSAMANTNCKTRNSLDVVRNRYIYYKTNMYIIQYKFVCVLAVI